MESHDSKQQLYCEAGDHFVDRNEHWSVNGFELCGDCMSCSTKEELEAIDNEVKYIFVLDFINESVYKYEVTNVQEQDYENYLDTKGHSMNNIVWMVTMNSEIKSL